MKPAVVLLSGGIDSTTTMAIAKTRGFDIFALSFDYKQRHRHELESAKMSAEEFGVKEHLIIKFDLRKIGGSALTSNIAVPKDRMQINENPKSQISNPKSQIPVTYVPARNTIFLSFALSWAETIGSKDIFIGANAIDYSGYPDCRPEFIEAFKEMANLATRASIEDGVSFRIHAPLIYLTKAEIIRKGLEFGVDFSKTWSCYDPQPATAGVKSSKLKVQSFKKKNSELNSSLATRRLSLVPCGRCDSCLLRAKGFKEAGINDPLTVKAER